MKYSPLMWRKLGVIGLFCGVFLGLAAIGPLTVLVFNLGVADPVTRGLPLATALILMALIAAGIITVAYAVGMFTKGGTTVPEKRLMYKRSVCWAVVALAIAPVIIFVFEMTAGLRGESDWLRRQGAAVLIVLAVYGVIAGRRTMRN
ncbi:hypothetical protein HED60_04320 [Planctomycetales bacterium ZRK34]|nr:hypothetical protein HED60_04320 [Planctomycetales bacterium ZRK34]